MLIVAMQEILKIENQSLGIAFLLIEKSSLDAVGNSKQFQYQLLR